MRVGTPPTAGTASQRGEAKQMPVLNKTGGRVDDATTAPSSPVGATEALLEVENMGKQFGKSWAVHESTFEVRGVPTRIPSKSIGRASCRERVCQYVSIWVGAVSTK